VIISHQADAEPAQGIEKGVAFLRKPFGISELRTVICDVLGIR